MPCTRHRVFLATLIVTAKYLNDSSPKNLHWANYAVMFDVAEINLMEKQLLYLLDYDLRFDEREICMLFAPFMVSATESSTSARVSAVNKVAKAGKARAEAQQQSQMLPTPAEVKDLEHSAPVHLATAAPLGSGLPASSSTTASSLTSAVRGIARRISTAHLRQAATSATMYSTLSTDTGSSASSSSDLASMVEDTGSSSSSSGWTSNDSDTGDEIDRTVNIVEPTSSSSSSNFGIGRPSTINPVLAGPGAMKKPFNLRPIPTQARKSASPSGKLDATPTRARKPSDTSSVHTLTASPSASRKQSVATRVMAVDCKLSASISKKASSASLKLKRSVIYMPASSTMPTIAHSTGVSSGMRLRSGTVSHRPSPASSSLVPPDGPTASQFTSTMSNGTGRSSTPTRSVGSLISRMWGAAAANLKVGVSSQTQGSMAAEMESRPLRCDNSTTS